METKSVPFAKNEFHRSRGYEASKDRAVFVNTGEFLSVLIFLQNRLVSELFLSGLKTTFFQILKVFKKPHVTFLLFSQIYFKAVTRGWDSLFIKYYVNITVVSNTS